MLVVFDDTNVISEVIRDVIGNKGFSDVVVKRRKLEQYYSDSLKKIFPEMKLKKVQNAYELQGLLSHLENQKTDEEKILHCFSNFIFADEEKALLTFEKIKYIDSDYRITADGKTAAIMFKNMDSYIQFLREAGASNSSMESAKSIIGCIPVEGLVDIGVIGNFIQCITGNFDSRYFNSLQGDEYTIVKKSTDKKKIKSEYTYYHLLPENMQRWFVLPFDYKEDEKTASYTMERFHMTDLAIKWVHGSVDEEEFERILNQYFYFFQERHEKEVSKEEYCRIADELYEKKVRERIDALKKKEGYAHIAKFMQASCKDRDIDSIYERYLNLKHKIEAKTDFKYISVIGHGDPCFSNALYNKSTRMLKFIDPKGALTEDDLWTNPYYDIAKLSHSVCGKYDFFNNGLFEIKISDRFESELIIEFDNTVYKEIFKKKLEENGYDYLTVRLYEASLFISMLPLHMDNPHKVFGFILNAENILDELEKEV